MPFHGHHGHSPNHTPSAASGLYQAAHQLGAVGAPQSALRVATGQTAAGTTEAQLDASSANASGAYGSPHASSASQPVPAASMSAPSSAVNSYNPQPFSTPKRPLASAREGEELHIPTGNQGIASQPPTMPQLYHTPNNFGGAAPNFVPSQSTQQSSHYSPTQHPAVPGALQPGASGRPGAASFATAPTTVPTMPQLNVNTNTQNSSNLARSTTVSSHGYSRSSPAGLDQKYQPMSAATPDTSNSKYPPTTPGQRYYPQTPSGAASNSPLGLADIRPQIAANLGEDALGPTTAPNEDFTRPAGNSNYLAPWPVYAFDWCKWNIHGGHSAGKMAVGSYLEDQHNFIQILDTQMAPQEVVQPGAPQYGLDFVKVAEATCAYPVTRILWEPPSASKASTDLLATSGDHLRLWSLPSSTPPSAGNTITRSSNRDSQPQKLQPLALLSNSKSPEHTAPLTSLDWNTLSPKLIITSSIDTTCTIWDIPTLTAKTQLIAHDREVFDVRFCAGSVDVFVSCGADGSVRMFDLRSLEHSTIIYEPSEKNDKDKAASPHPSSSPVKTPFATDPTVLPSSSSAAATATSAIAPPTPTAPPTPPALLRLAASPHDAHLLATFAADSNLIRILDVRQPGTALLELKGHSAAVNAVEWAPQRRGCLASGGDDGLVLVWDLLGSSAAAGGTGGVATPATAAAAGATPNGVAAAGSGSAGGTAGAAAGHPAQVGQEKAPSASWRCEYEVGNMSWAPNSSLTGQGGEWLGVSGGRGIWGVKL
ncbi:MAG: hypothetical protein M1822_009479 [Bathelium mastoideum]|nr:MAG: hypothetical protein M1822_009479 [Bathelium mastoideum]